MFFAGVIPAAISGTKLAGWGFLPSNCDSRCGPKIIEKKHPPPNHPTTSMAQTFCNPSMLLGWMFELKCSECSSQGVPTKIGWNYKFHRLVLRQHCSSLPIPLVCLGGVELTSSIEWNLPIPLALCGAYQTSRCALVLGGAYQTYWCALVLDHWCALVLCGPYLFHWCALVLCGAYLFHWCALVL